MSKFKARARTVDMLGRQQVAGIPTAISELFKNAHDAYADYAEVDYFRELDLFVLRDDGLGMTEEDFENRWLAIGTESKLGADTALKPPPKPDNKPERPVMGEKGIGRLAVAAIGPQALILTRAKRMGVDHPIVAAFINWGIFEVPGINLDEIDIPVVSYPATQLPSRDQVRALVELFEENLVRLREEVQPELRERIQGELEAFKVDLPALDAHLKTLSPPTLTGDGHGTHFFITPTRDALKLDLQSENEEESVSPIFKTLIGFTNTIKGESEPLIQVAFRDHKRSDLYEDIIDRREFFTPEDFKITDHYFQGDFDKNGTFRGKVVIYGQEPVNYSISWKDGKELSECGPFKINLAYVQGEQKFSRLSPQDFTQVSRKLRRVGGLYIYRDGIRILPYGNSSYDFLDFEQRRSRSAGRYYFSHRRMCGYIELSRDANWGLSEKAGREGFQENKAYKQFHDILKKFFIQMAADFFREGGKASAGYLESKAERERLAEARKRLEEKNKTEQKRFARDIDDFFALVESETLTREVQEIVAEVVKKLQRPLMIDEISLVEIETDARDRIDTLRARCTVKKPDVGLTPQLRRDWEAYLDESKRLEADVFAKTTQEVAKLIADFAERSREQISRQSQAKRLRQVRVQQAKKALEIEVERIRKALSSAQKQVESALRAIVGELDKLAEPLANDPSGVESEKRIREETEKRRNRLGRIGRQLTAVSDLASGARDATEELQALEEENIALRERSEAELELAQLGMAIAVISHEFDSTVRGIRTELKSLKAWVDINPKMQNLYVRLRNGFDHLDGYLTLFTPLQRRLYRSKTEIHGPDIAKYLEDLFVDRLKQTDVKMEMTERFRERTIVSYPSTFYPVFVNLVDNALFWLKDQKDRRVITLDAEGDAFLVSDTGPGVAPRDRESIFEPGFTRKPGGRGMGLAISREVLAKEGYALTLDESNVAIGATFRIAPAQSSDKTESNEGETAS